ncbi:MAG TPA: hypothetical protein VJP79_11435 [Nitrososphaera sp.]|nr:hypothetical protein [Nitrososphaera sp.]
MYDTIETEGIGRCKCGSCDHDHRSECIAGRCYCCDLEDAFSLLTHHEFEEAHSGLVADDKRLRRVASA